MLECEQLKRIAMRADGGGIVPHYTWSFEPAGEGTDLLQELHATVGGPLRLLSPLLTWQFRRDSSRALTEAKRQLERTGSTDTP